MRRASDLFGLPVIGADQRPLGTVREILVDLREARLAALVIPVKVLAEPVLIPVGKALRIGSEDIRVPGPEAVISGEDAALLRRGNLTLEKVRKLTVETSSGNHLGNVEDLVLDGSRIAAIELSDGLLQDIFQGREQVILSGEVRVEEEKIIVPDGTQCLAQEQSQQGTWRRDQGF